ncbi:ASTRA-associated protein 1 [Purpureocillium lavendulum]|uniref:ASTRA-associated protein 1 n=1 Tax=Purpureocillium lavendulum TaxID=1247861 RepID=A0AB34FWG8_9HYPO|nr:ASTRA-associated protein 1 [Purpureocillium lavendulum]
MPAPSYPIPSFLPPLHLYRHILREVSYLPPAFRATISSTIRDRFHRHRRYDPRAKAHLSRASSALRTLRAANSGDRTAMAGLISKGFARSGRRRRELMAQFVKPQGPSNSQDLEALLDQPDATQSSASKEAADKGRPKKPKNAFFQKWDQKKLLQLLQSQKHQQKETKGSTSWPGTAIKSTDQDQFVPAANIWGKPPAESLVRTKQAHWWRRSAEKIMPPLGKGEWDLLERLSNGAQNEPEWAVPARRPMPKSLVEADNTSETLDWEAWAAQPAAAVEKQNSMAHRMRSGRTDAGPYGGKDRKPTVSARWFRRAYNRTWQLTPTMSQDPNTLRYSFKWGTVQPKLPTPTATQLEIFEGVDKRGHKIGKGSAS